MQNLKELNAMLETLNKLSKDIISTSLTMFRKIDKNEASIVSSIYTDLLMNGVKVDTREIVDALHKISLVMPNDAETVSRELVPFVRQLTDGNFNKDTFLYKVWKGDIYDAKGKESLIALIEDLKGQLSNIRVDIIVDNAKRSIQSSKSIS